MLKNTDLCEICRPNCFLRLHVKTPVACLCDDHHIPRCIGVRGRETMSGRKNPFSIVSMLNGARDNHKDRHKGFLGLTASSKQHDSVPYLQQASQA